MRRSLFGISIPKATCMASTTTLLLNIVKPLLPPKTLTTPPPTWHQEHQEHQELSPTAPSARLLPSSTRPKDKPKSPRSIPRAPQDGSTESANCGRANCCYIWRKRCLSQFQQSVCPYFCSYSSRHIPFSFLKKPRHLTWCRRGRTQTSAVALPSLRSTGRPSAGTMCAPLLSPGLGSLRMPMM